MIRAVVFTVVAAAVVVAVAAGAVRPTLQQLQPMTVADAPVVVQDEAVASCSGVLPAGHPPVPCATIPRCDNGGGYSVAGFTLANGVTPMSEATKVTLCYDDSFLHLQYENQDDKYLKNTYMTCNSETWNQEVVEVFISQGLDDPTLYYEVELTPKDVLYVAQIHNPYKNGTDKHNTMIDCAASGIQYSATADASTSSWSGNLALPFSLIGNPTSGSTYRLNLFRVVMQQDVDVCDVTTCDFGCWSPTFTNPPAFHVTPYFAVGILA